MMLAMRDFGGGTNTPYKLALGTRWVRMYTQGAGGGGGGGGPNGGGGGGGSGNSNAWIFWGDALSEMVIYIRTGIPGQNGDGSTSGGTDGTGGTPTFVTWPNEFVIETGGGEGGKGQRVGQFPQGGRAGNAAYQDPPVMNNEGKPWPNGLKCGQENGPANNGQCGCGSLGGWGGQTGDAGGGGKGGDLAAKSLITAQAGYVHLECHG